MASKIIIAGTLYTAILWLSGSVTSVSYTHLKPDYSICMLNPMKQG